MNDPLQELTIHVMDTYQALKTSLDTLKCYGDRQMNFYFYKVFQYNSLYSKLITLF